MTIDRSTARAAADVTEGLALATVEVAAPPERAFRALVSDEILAWWVRPGVFDTREWSADVRPGGRWAASGVGNGRPYTLEGEFLEIDPPYRLVHTWRLVGVPAAPTTVTYLIDAVGAGTRITLRQTGFDSPDVCIATAIGWETSFEELRELLGSEAAAERRQSRP